jgi:hypothetical protein
MKRRRLRWVMPGLIGAGLWLGAYAVAEELMVGDAPDHYRPLLGASPVAGIDLNAGAALLQNQILASAAQVHNVRSNSLVFQPLTIPTRASRSLPASVSPSAASVVTSTSMGLPPDPDFSYLSELLPNLPFVQEIQEFQAVAGVLGSIGQALSAPDLMQMDQAFAFLSLRSVILQYASQNAWGWMMGNAANGSLPLVMEYQTALGNDIKIYDVYLPTAQYAFKPQDLTALRNLLDILPASVLTNITAIVNGPVFEMTGWGSLTGGSQISIEGGGEINAPSLPHEIGVTVWESNLFQNAPLGREWQVLWNGSTHPVWDTVEPDSYYPPRPMPSNEPTPWGDRSEGEDVATIFNDWVNDSATPRLNPNQSSSILEQAIYAASQAGLPGGPPEGDSVLLQKVLLMAALFTDAAARQVAFYSYENYQYGAPIQRVMEPVSLSSTQLVLGNYTFTVVNGALTGVTSPASQATVNGQVVNIPALNYTFSTPVPIPAYAAGLWE